MKKILKNKKGFTLIELLAVIVVLAVIMVIATQQINRTIARARANSMISSLKMAAKGIKTKLTDGSMAACDSNCLKDVIDYDDGEYEITVTEADNDWMVTLTAQEGSEFASADFNEVKGFAKGKVGKITVNVAKKNDSKYPEISCKVDGDTGAIIE